MFSSPLYYQRPNKRRASSPFAKCLNAGALALVMLVALVLFAVIRDNKSETKDSTPGKSTKSETVIDKRQTLPPLTARPFVNRMINAVKDAFNDPSITAYANEQGFDLPDSPATSLPTASGQPFASSNLSTQSTKSASGH